MRTYTALFAVDVPHYGTHQITADNPADAIAQAKKLDPADLCDDPDWSNSACSRIVSIRDDIDGRTVAEGVALDGAFLRYGGEPARLLCDAALELREALERMIARVDDIVNAICTGAGTELPEQFARLSEAAEDAEKIVLKAKGEA
jgi:hypothetical protein